MDEAHTQQAMVTGHLESVGCAETAERGIDNIEHSWFSATNIQDLSDVTHVYANGMAHDPPVLPAEVKRQVGWR